MHATDALERGRADRPGATGWRAVTPNALTIARLGMAAAFVGLLSIPFHGDGLAAAISLAAALFIAAALTDAADGYLARRWNAVTPFGRVADPFADKVLVLGAYVLLAAPPLAPGSGVQPWMAVVILARELLVTSLRGVYEARGVAFAAGLSGKVKMVIQSIGAPVGLIAAARWHAQPIAHAISPPIDPHAAAHAADGWATLTAWGVTLVTAWSAWPYLARAVRASRADSRPESLPGGHR